MSYRNRMVTLAAVVAMGSILVGAATPADARVGAGFGGGYRGGVMRTAPQGGFAARPMLRPNFAFNRTASRWGQQQQQQQWPQKPRPNCIGRWCGGSQMSCGYGRPCNGGTVWNGTWGSRWPYPRRPIIVAPGPTYVTPSPVYGGYQTAAVTPAPVPVPAPVPAPVPQPVVQTYQPVAAPCTCLKKEYTQEGQVVFQDVCTNEALTGPAGQQAQVQPQQYQYQR